MEQFGLLRIHFDSFDYNKFYQAVEQLYGSQYNLMASDIDAPGVTHCVSAVRYLIQKASGYTFPLMYIGDMCRNILDKGVFHTQIIPLSHGDIGDLLFFRGTSRVSRLPAITHVGILVDDEFFFHSTYGRGGLIYALEQVQETGTIATCRILSSYTDERGKNGKYIKNS